MIHLSSDNRTKAVPVINDGIKENGSIINAVLIYNDVAPEIKTTLVDRATEEHIASYSEKAELVDTVSYKFLLPGHYVMSGVLMDKESGKALVDKDGKEITATAEFDVSVVKDEFGNPKPQSGSVKVVFTLDTTLLQGVTLVAYEELHSVSVTGTLVAEHKDINDVNQTIHVPEIKTTATDADNGTKTLTYKERVDIRDKVTYTNLIIGKTYVATGTLYNAKTGEIYKDNEGKTYTASTEFMAETADGFVYVDFKSVVVPYEKTAIVVFENLSYKEKNVNVAVHADLTDKDQTVERPTASTTATVDGAKAVWLGSTEVRNITITDTISYTGFEVGNTYRAVATLYKADGTPITKGEQPVVSMVEFVPTTKDGAVDVNITFSTAGLSEGDRIVVFEAIFDVATETEIAEKTQTEDLLMLILVLF